MASVIPERISELKIIHYPGSELRRRAGPVTRFDERLSELAQRMVELMFEFKGVGLAAPQVGVLLRIFVSNHTGEPEDTRIFVNPKLEVSGEMVSREEGCLSIPQVYGDVTRPARTAISAQDLQGNLFLLTDEEFAARVWQHESDHLDGRLIIDRFSMTTKLSVRKLLAELESKSTAKR